MKKVKKEDLNVVQNLYLMQLDMNKVLESDLKDPQEVKQAKEQVKEFSSLLKKADWQYMGGEDVLEDLKNTEKEVKEKLKKAK